MGKYLVLRAFPELVRQMNKRIQKHKENLLWYMLFLRITPLVPNWFINVSSPIVGIPFFHFFLATLFGIYFIRSNNKIGLMPANIIQVKTGLMLKEVESIGFNWKNFALLFCLAFVALIPTLFKKHIKKNMDYS